MRLAFVCSGRPDKLKYLNNNRIMVDKLLMQYGWEVINTPLYNISDLNKRLREYENSSISEFLFYYTGHGDVSNRREILKLSLDDTEISLNDILDSTFKYLNPKQQVIILDACYSGTLKDLNLENNIEFLFSSQAKQQSYEDDLLKASVFSFYFCEALTNGYIKLEEVSEYIASCDNRQNPLPLSVGSERISILGLDIKVKKKLISSISNSKDFDMEEKLKKIENLIISNDLIIATGLIVELSSNFSKQIRREAILHQSNLNAMNEELRKLGENEKFERRFRQLKNSLFEFLDILREK